MNLKLRRESVCWKKTNERFFAFNDTLSLSASPDFVSDALETLKSDFPADYQSMIEHLSEYMAYTGKTYKNHLATMECWKRADMKKGQEKGKGYSYNSNFKEGESL